VKPRSYALIAAPIVAALAAGQTSRAQTTNAELRAKSVFLEAESLRGFAQDGWRVRDAWGLPARSQASGDATAHGGRPGTTIWQNIRIPTTGTHKVWARYMHIGPYYSSFGIRIEQGGQTVFDETYWERHVVRSTSTGPAWEHFEAYLNAGPATLTVYVREPKPPRATLRVDCLLITPIADYEPDLTDFGPQVFVRFKILEPEDTAHVARLAVLRHRKVDSPAEPGYLSAAGHGKRGDPVPTGKFSAWGDISQLLDMGERVTTVSFRFMSGPNETPSALKVDLDIASAPDENHIAKSLHEEIDGDTVGIILPGDVTRYDDSIQLVSAETAAHRRYADSLPLTAEGLPQRFPIEARIAGYRKQHASRRMLEAETAVLAKLGFNTLQGLAGTPREVARERGIERSLWSHYIDGLPPWLPDLRKRIDKDVADAYGRLKAGDPDALAALYRFKLAHTPRAASPTPLRQSEDCAAAFRSYLRHCELTPEALGRPGWDDVLPTSRSQMAGPEDAAIYYHTMKFRDALTALPYKYATDAVEKRFPKGILSSVTFDPEPIGRGDGMIEGPDWFELAERGRVRMLWSLDGGGPRLTDTPLVADLLRSAARQRGRRIGLSLQSGDPDSLRLRTYSALAHGAKAIRYYRYGPHYATPDGAWSEYNDRAQEIARLTREIGRAEELVYPGRPPKAHVAMVYSKSSEIWQDDTAALAELRQTYFALLMENTPVDFVTEEHVAEGALSDYRACYLLGANLTRAAAEAVAGWVKEGGMLYGCVAAGSRDEYNRPSDVLAPVFGVQHHSVERVESRFREYYDIPKLTPLTQVTVAGNDWVPACTFDVLGHRGYATATTGEVLGADGNGHPVVVWNKHGAGEALYISAFPALAWRQQAPLPDGYLMPRYSQEFAKLITALARHANADGPVRTSHYMVECGYLASEGGAALPLMNWSRRRTTALGVTVVDVPEPKSVESLVRGVVQFSHFQNKLDVVMPIGLTTDILLIRW
jgi:hypothetical protein